MAIDKETKIEKFNVTFANNSELLAKGKKLAEEYGVKNSIQLNEENLESPILTADEIYFEEGVLHICIDNPQLNIYLEVPICDSVMIDILSEQIKKLNKLKLVMESLK